MPATAAAQPPQYGSLDCHGSHLGGAVSASAVDHPALQHAGEGGLTVEPVVNEDATGETQEVQHLARA